MASRLSVIHQRLEIYTLRFDLWAVWYCKLTERVRICCNNCNGNLLEHLKDIDTSVRSTCLAEIFLYRKLVFNEFTSFLLCVQRSNVKNLK